MGDAASEPAGGLERLDVASSTASSAAARSVTSIACPSTYGRAPGSAYRMFRYIQMRSVPSFRTTRITPLSCACSRMRER